MRLPMYGERGGVEDACDEIVRDVEVDGAVAGARNLCQDVDAADGHRHSAQRHHRRRNALGFAEREQRRHRIIQFG